MFHLFDAIEKLMPFQALCLKGFFSWKLSNAVKMAGYYTENLLNDFHQFYCEMKKNMSAYMILNRTEKTEIVGI